MTSMILSNSNDYNINKANLRGIEKQRKQFSMLNTSICWFYISLIKKNGSMHTSENNNDKLSFILK